MFRTVVLGRANSLREAAEVFIAKIYAGRYGAHLHSFPSRIVALVDERDKMLCAAGLRFAADGFFSENYLDVPIGRSNVVRSSKSQPWPVARRARPRDSSPASARSARDRALPRRSSP
jgi:hypothetical protein